jgi:hypothetical protein
VGETAYLLAIGYGSAFRIEKVTSIFPKRSCLSNAANQTGLGLSVEPNAAGLAITADGTTLVAANN